MIYPLAFVLSSAICNGFQAVSDFICRFIKVFCVSNFVLMSSLALAADKPATFPDYRIEEVVGGLNFPWSLAFLPGGDLLVTEKTGQLKVVRNGEVSNISLGLPEGIYAKGQGGLLDVALHPDYAKSGWLYLSYAIGTDDKNALRVMRAKLDGDKLIGQEVIFTVSPYKGTPVHFAGRMAFLPDNSLLVTSGDGFDYREDAQRKNNLLGKIIRILDDGSIPPDNPFVGLSKSDVGSKGEALEGYVYSYGHRNPQAILYDPVRRLVFSNEHGPAGGDEINIIRAGDNYGWPVITNGRDYSGARISPFTEYRDMRQPMVDWTPSIAPSGMAVYYGKMFSQLNGDLLSTSLKFKQVYWTQMADGKVMGENTLFSEIGERLRDIRIHSDGSIYLLTDSEIGKILRIVQK